MWILISNGPGQTWKITDLDPDPSNENQEFRIRILPLNVHDD